MLGELGWVGFGLWGPDLLWAGGAQELEVGAGEFPKFCNYETRKFLKSQARHTIK